MDDAISLGADVAHMAIGIVAMVACYQVGLWVTHRTRKLLAGWAAGITAFVGFALIIGPLMAQLNSARCHNDTDPGVCETGGISRDY